MPPGKTPLGIKLARYAGPLHVDQYVVFAIGHSPQDMPKQLICSCLLRIFPSIACYINKQRHDRQTTNNDLIFNFAHFGHFFPKHLPLWACFLIQLSADTDHLSIIALFTLAQSTMILSDDRIARAYVWATSFLLAPALISARMVASQFDNSKWPLSIDVASLIVPRNIVLSLHKASRSSSTFGSFQYRKDDQRTKGLATIIWQPML